MKKALALALCIIITGTTFAACTKSEENKIDGVSTQTAIQTTKPRPTDKAVVKDAEAIDLIKGYSDKELGLDGETRGKCSFMVASSGEVIEEKGYKGDYIKVIAAIKNERKNEESGEVTFTLDTKGEYYISFDGNTVLSKNMESGKFTKLKASKTSTKEKETTKAAEKNND